MTVSEPQIPYDVASRLEEGAVLDSPTVSSTETFNEKPSRSDTVLSRGTSSLLGMKSLQIEGSQLLTFALSNRIENMVNLFSCWNSCSAEHVA